MDDDHTPAPADEIHAPVPAAIGSADSEKEPLPRLVGISIGFLLAAVITAALYVVFDPFGYSSKTCEDLAGDAVKASKAQGGDPTLLAVHDPVLVTDARERFERPAEGERASLMVCEADATWGDGREDGVRLFLNVDSAGRTGATYEPYARKSGVAS